MKKFEAKARKLRIYGAKWIFETPLAQKYYFSEIKSNLQRRSSTSQNFEHLTRQSVLPNQLVENKN